MMKFTDEQASALIAAGRILQSKEWHYGQIKIKKMNGERYPESVKKAIDSLTENQKEHLRDLISWVRDYEKNDF